MPKWKLSGYDAFAKEPYPLGGSFSSEGAAERAAQRRLGLLELMQPSEVSGGQAGIQDQVFIHRPDGTSYRYLPAEPVRPALWQRLAWKLGVIDG